MFEKYLFLILKTTLSLKYIAKTTFQTHCQKKEPLGVIAKILFNQSKYLNGPSVKR